MQKQTTGHEVTIRSKLSYIVVYFGGLGIKSSLDRAI